MIIKDPDQNFALQLYAIYIILAGGATEWTRIYMYMQEYQTQRNSSLVVFGNK